MKLLERAPVVPGNWLWLCPMLALALATAALMIWGLTLWTATIAALLLVCPALIIWGVVALSRDGSQG